MQQLFDPLPDSTTRRKENTRQRLVRASLGVFVDKGIDGATIDDLVSAAGYTRGAFYSNFSTKLEVFGELFADVTDQVIAIITASVGEMLEEIAAAPGDAAALDDAGMMLRVFEAIRPHGRQWYLLYSEAVAYSLRNETAREQLTEQRTRLREVIAAILESGMRAKGEHSVIAVSDLAQMLVGSFVDLMVIEHLEGTDTSNLASVTILRTMRAFVEPDA